MKAVIDANVLFPTVLREIVLGVAENGAFTPLWSARILEEWRRAAARLGERDAALAESEIAVAKARFPGAMVEVLPGTDARLWLPDPDDVHVLAAAVDGRAEAILTLNSGDFPPRVLAEEGVVRRHPDEFLLEVFQARPDQVREVIADVLERAKSYGIETENPRGLMKRAKLPRLGKALFAAG
jgi:predicted nucleic acid-binding protein